MESLEQISLELCDSVAFKAPRRQNDSKCGPWKGHAFPPFSFQQSSDISVSCVRNDAHPEMTVLFPAVLKEGRSYDWGSYVFRNCTKSGWTDLYPSYEDACEFQEYEVTESETSYYSTFRQVYTVGYATSLVSLITAIFVLTVFSRKFRCTRNYIHMNLFASFILRASSVFIKDVVLFEDETLDHCFMSTTACKAVVVFFQFSILANYFWLLVEGMYLQTLLALTFVSQKKYFWWYILIGWGVPAVFLTIWVLTRNFYDNRGCWDDTDYAVFWWIIKGPITASLLINFVIFINVIRILVQKLKSPGVGGNDSSHFMRLAKSTLFLIPLFGMHYILFAFLPESMGEDARLYIELGLGSFQGFGVALLYCFLNGEVQAELKKRLCKWQSQSYLNFTKRRRTLFTESSTVTQISVLEKPSPKDLLLSEGHNSVSSPISKCHSSHWANERSPHMNTNSRVNTVLLADGDPVALRST
ncbi:pituitary adenylate cyclase-activating polypeptide type I receptor-like [Scleropages formosus]|uniref:Pituitary adenylate cyclase-activating polypeptide type I receptor-like n=1 Tax=Scleropages formosus TaxID=113540 RepID=A0A0P7VC81_SCLFO|nr:pituitary adenylate cyclase-activating polypeptide type I receptor-like [Scleropages formosus]